MKKTLFVLLAITLGLTMLSGCIKPNADNGKTPNSDENNKQTQNLPDSSVLNNFSEYLDNENFVPDISQGDFISQMGKYTYEGDKISDILRGHFLDGLWGGSYNAYGDLFGFANEYRVTEDEKYANYSNSFYTEVALDGLTLPYGIDFDDTLAEVFQKIGIEKDPYNDFIADENWAGKMTLCKDDNSTLVFTDCKQLDSDNSSGKPLYEYSLEYTEIYQATLQDGRPVTVTRTVGFSFLEGDNKLGSFNMKVNECITRSVNDH